MAYRPNQSTRRIKKNFGQAIGRVQSNIQRKVSKGFGFSLRPKVRRFGFMRSDR